MVAANISYLPTVLAESVTSSIDGNSTFGIEVDAADVVTVDSELASPVQLDTKNEAATTTISGKVRKPLSWLSVTKVGGS